ncbi:diguanylate cyclase [Salmonella enterica subsp. enterica serovar Kentucky]|nr:diguanylate cyclase [Salmonella enterica subsp. enterica serovar Kentucky]
MLSEIQFAHEQRSRLDTLIRSYAAQDTKTGLGNRLFFDNQLATLLEDQEKVGVHGVVMMIRLPDFNLLRDSREAIRRKSRCLCLSICYRHLLCVTGLAAGALSPQRLCRAATASNAKRSGKYCRTTFKSCRCATG